MNSRLTTPRCCSSPRSWPRDNKTTTRVPGQEQGLREHPEVGRFYLALAAIETRNGWEKEAESYVRRGLEKNDTNPELLWEIANLLLDSHRPDEVDSLVARLRKASVAQPLLAFLEARLLLNEKRWRDAADNFSKVRPRSGQASRVGPSGFPDRSLPCRLLRASERRRAD